MAASMPSRQEPPAESGAPRRQRRLSLSDESVYFVMIAVLTFVIVSLTYSWYLYSEANPSRGRGGDLESGAQVPLPPATSGGASPPRAMDQPADRAARSAGTVEPDAPVSDAASGGAGPGKPPSSAAEAKPPARPAPPTSVAESAAAPPPVEPTDGAPDSQGRLVAVAPATGAATAPPTPPPAEARGEEPGLSKVESDSIPGRESTTQALLGTERPARAEAAHPVESDTAMTRPDPAGQIAALAVPREEIEALIRRGDQFLATGDIAAARVFYERAAAGGNSAAATGVGKTFDPLFLAQIGAQGMRGDPAEAASWYRKASETGEREAASRLKALLEKFPQ